MPGARWARLEGRRFDRCSRLQMDMRERTTDFSRETGAGQAERRRAKVGRSRYWHDCVQCPLQAAKQTSVPAGSMAAPGLLHTLGPPESGRSTEDMERALRRPSKSEKSSHCQRRWTSLDESRNSQLATRQRVKRSRPRRPQSCRQEVGATASGLRAILRRSVDDWAEAARMRLRVSRRRRTSICIDAN